ncbi:hypothetical protein GCM10023331_21270 [Algivirga pacifica]|uniref:peptidylprolyl isomerase n=1 Tax=Algivirga pacifica TaxID=1162670 RepID=A0ABP9DAS5_9BACT
MYRKEAVHALASIQDVKAEESLFEILRKDPDPEVRKAAAFAIGQMGRVPTERQLIVMIPKLEEYPEVQKEVLEAIGKCASSIGEDFLVRYASAGNTQLDYGRMRGLYRAALRGLMSEGGVNWAIRYLKEEVPYDLKLMSAYYLGRVKAKAWLQNKETQLIRLYLQETEDVIKSNIITSMASLLPNQKVSDFLLSQLKSGHLSDELLIACIRALEVYKEESYLEEMLSLLKGQNPNVEVVAAEYFQGRIDSSQLESFLGYAKSITNARAKALYLRALLTTDPSNTQVNDYLLAIYQESNNIYEQGMYLRAMAASSLNYELIVKVIKETTNPIMLSASMESLVMLVNHSTQYKRLLKRRPDVEKEVAILLKEAIESRDIAAVYFAARALRNPKHKYYKHLENTDFIRQVMEALQLPRDVEAYLELQKTWASLKGEPFQAPVNEYKQNTIDWQYVAEIPKQQRVIITTSKGEVEVTLLVDEAPGTVANICQLIEEQFFDNTVFHRVVPNFVVQGGCSRGDGFGSMDETTRSEFTAHTFETGTVGLASVGKDAESAQWFITTMPAPHLDGRYTMFGQVSKGLEVVRMLEIGDVIYEVRLAGFL